MAKEKSHLHDTLLSPFEDEDQEESSHIYRHVRTGEDIPNLARILSGGKGTGQRNRSLGCDDLLLLSPRSAAAVLEQQHGNVPDMNTIDSYENHIRTLPDRANDLLLPTTNHAMAMLKLTVPLSLANMLFFMTNIINIVFVGQLGDFPLAVSVLATTLFNVTGFSFVCGFNAVLESLCGQAYGARKYGMVGVYLQRCIMLDGVLCSVMIALWLHAEKIFVFVGQEPDVAKAAARFILIMAPGLLGIATFESLKRYLSCQNIARPVSITTGFAVVMCPVYNWLFIHVCGLGIDGAALAAASTNATLGLSLLAITMYIENSKTDDPTAEIPRTWYGWTLEALEPAGIWKFMYLGSMSVVMVVAEWTAFECLTILAGLLPKPKVSIGSVGILLNLGGISYTIVSGISLSCSILVSSALGSTNWTAAKKFATIALGYGIIVEMVAAFVLFLSRDRVGSWMTSSTDVISCVSAAIPYFAFSLLGDGVNASMQGVLRGTAKMTLGAVINVCSYWMFGIPLAYYLAFRRSMGVSGLWCGIAINNTVLGLVMTVVAHTINFQNESLLAARHVSSTLLQNENSIPTNNIDNNNNNNNLL